MTLAAAGYKNKKNLKESIGQPLNYEETSMFGPQYLSDGQFSIVGPSAYDRKWFARVTMKAGLIVRVT